MSNPRVNIETCEMSDPMDVSELVSRLRRLPQDEDVVAIIGKTHGSGLHDDYGRALAERCVRGVLREVLGTRVDAENVPVVFSGGAFGIISPHLALITKQEATLDRGAAPAKRLTVGTATSEEILPEEIGRVGQIVKVAEAVRAAQASAGIPDSADVHCVVVKGPTLTPESVRQASSRGRDVVTLDLGTGDEGAMCYANDGSALGVAVALGEVDSSLVRDEVVRRDWSLFSEVAFASAAGEKKRAEVVLFGNAVNSSSEISIGHGITQDMLDQNGIKTALRDAGLEFECCPSDTELGRIVYVFAKLSVPADGRVRGRSTTLAVDPEAAKTAKVVGGVLIGSITGTTMMFVSAGERNTHQGPPGGSPVAAVVTTRERVSDQAHARGGER